MGACVCVHLYLTEVCVDYVWVYMRTHINIDVRVYSMYICTSDIYNYMRIHICVCPCTYI